MEPLSLRYDVAGGTLVYVSAAAGDDSGDELSPEAAKKSLQSALAAANAPRLGADCRRRPRARRTGPFVLPAGVSLYGGFAAGFSLAGRRRAPFPDRWQRADERHRPRGHRSDDGHHRGGRSPVRRRERHDEFDRRRHLGGCCAFASQKRLHRAKGANSAGAFAVALSVASGATIRGDVMRGGRAYFTAGIRVTAGRRSSRTTSSTAERHRRSRMAHW